MLQLILIILTKQMQSLMRALASHDADGNGSHDKKNHIASHLIILTKQKWDDAIDDTVSIM